MKKSTEINKHLQFEQMISNLSARFINIPAEMLDDEIEKALKTVLEFFQVDRCALVQSLPGRTSWCITHVAASLDAPPIPKGTVLPRSINPWGFEKLTEKGEVISFSNLDEVPPEGHVDKQTWQGWGICSNLNIPILLGQSVDHIIAINSVTCERIWPEAYIPRLQLLGEIFVSALERRNAELALRESEERLNLAASAADTGIWMIDTNTGRLWATEKTREIFQFSPGRELSFEHFLERVHGDDRDSARATLAQCLQTRDLVRLEYRIALPDGSIRWVVSRGRSYPAAAEQPERVMGVVIDITSRKEMEALLQSQLAEIRQLKDQLEKENIYLRDEAGQHQGQEGIIAHSGAMKKILAQLEQVAATDATVLLTGETGTGKELLARRIHALSHRKDRTLISVNCAALPPTLIENELFGREKGAYTGALTRMAGRFEVADGSTLFLDEIGELTPGLQTKLLRVLEEGTFERVGSTRTQTVDVRVVAATNRNLVQEVAEGRFRSDLYYRLNVFPIAIPPLRERPEDVPPLVWKFVKQNEKTLGKRIDRIPRKNMDALKRYAWPGNCRELGNIIEHAMIMSSGGILRVSLPNAKSKPAAAAITLDEADRQHILSVLTKTGWRIAGTNGAAEILGLKRTTLQAKMKKLGIHRPTK